MLTFLTYLLMLKLILKSHATLRLTTINVGTLVCRSAEVTENVGRRRVDTVALQEVRYRKKGEKTLRESDLEYTLY